MGKMFDMDNPVWRFMGKVTDMFFLTCLWPVSYTHLTLPTKLEV